MKKAREAVHVLRKTYIYVEISEDATGVNQREIAALAAPISVYAITSFIISFFRESIGRPLTRNESCILRCARISAFHRFLFSVNQNRSIRVIPSCDVNLFVAYQITFSN